jgi:hypothetical protein
MSRRMILRLAALILSAAAVFGCGGSKSATKTGPKAGTAVIALRTPLDLRGTGTDAALLRFGVPKGWKGNEDPNRRLPVAAIEKPGGSGICRFFVQIVAGPRGGRGLLQPGEGELLRQSGANKRSVKVIGPGPPRVATFSFAIYDAHGALSPEGPAAVSVGEFQITGEPAGPPLVVIARGGLDGCTTKVPVGVVAETRSALQALIDQMSIEIRRPG